MRKFILGEYKFFRDAGFQVTPEEVEAGLGALPHVSRAEISWVLLYMINYIMSVNVLHKYVAE